MKSLLSYCLAMVCAVAIQAQCVPDTTYSGPGFYTNDGDSTLDQAHLNGPYSENVTLYVPNTYDIGGFNVNVDSVKIEGITGLPDGIGSACNPTSCFWIGGDTGCVLISGTPSNSAQLGNNPLTISMRYFGLGTSVTEDVTVFSIELVDTTQSNTSITDLSLNKGLKIYPNPANNKLNVFFGAESDIQDLHIINITGQTVWFNSDDNKNHFSIDSSKLPVGLYFYRFKTSGDHQSLKLVIEH